MHALHFLLLIPAIQQKGDYLLLTLCSLELTLAEEEPSA
jgi:hypothetical protein